MKLTKVPEQLRKKLTSYVHLPVFVSEIPSYSDEGISVRMLEGNPNITYFGQEGNLYQPLYQVFIRTKQYQTGSDSAQIIKDILDKYTIKGLLMLRIVGSVLYLGQSEQKMHEFQLTFSAILKEED